MLRRHRPTRTGLALLAVLALLVGCTSSTPRAADPTTEVAAFAAAWQGGDLVTAAGLTDDAPAATQLLKQSELNLSPSEFAVTPGAVTRTSDTTATATAAVSWTLGDAGQWAYDVDWTWTLGESGWRLDWSPTDVHPQLGPQQGLTVRITKAIDGTIVDRDDNQLVNPVPVFSILALKDSITDVPGTAATLATVLAPFDATLTAADIEAGIVASEPTTGYTVLNLRQADFDTVAAQLAALPGIATPSEVRNLPPTRDFAKSLLGQVTPVATEMMTGTSGWRIATIDTTGAEIVTLAEQPAVQGQKVTLTLDSDLQQAADRAVGAITLPAVVVAMQPSTGEVLTVAQNAAADAQGTIALSGRYPPGSIFKIVTATAGIDDAGLTPVTKVPCPGVTTIDSRPIRNAHDFDLGTVDLTLAFAKSCNTTFAEVASALPADALHATAKEYGVGLDFDMKGAITLTGQSPVAESVVEQAENGFGQGRDLVSPFGAALMAATVAHGSMPIPTLIRGTTTTVDEPAPPRSAAASAALPVLMAAVTAEGTGSQLQGFGDIRLKTGTAEYSDETGALKAHAWTVGYLGDMAFAAFIAGGDDSVRTNELATSFLTNAGLG
ncbi:penicillin-binding transpeptidase domain-containing protein [Nakamurella deserti]|uniref:penicillin-binding transpeptidase domain-containing protein n=1 Tax=Nakamurella deserti TaxID=2164074 RepID=UPI001300972F|nr:penicillin-binding transpeptidase domain-containing protein [Nakamurella deserti]